MKLVTITPEMAKQMLENNNINRSISKLTVKRYVKEMLLSNWSVNGETIKLSKSGKLLDGQHRLKACIESGMPFKSYVIDDLKDDESEKIFTTIDQGKQRTNADILSSGKIQNSCQIAAASTKLRWFYVVKNKNLAGVQVKSTKYELLIYTRAHLENLEKFLSLTRPLYNKTKLVNFAFLTAFSTYLFELGCEEELILDFLKKLCLGYGGEKEAPNQLRTFLLSKNSFKNIYHNEIYYRHYISIAWNCFVKGTQFRPNTCKYEDTETYPEIIINDD